jgi:hypothetical protein
VIAITDCDKIKLIANTPLAGLVIYDAYVKEATYCIATDTRLPVVVEAYGYAGHTKATEEQAIAVAILIGDLTKAKILAESLLVGDPASSLYQAISHLTAWLTGQRLFQSRWATDLAVSTDLYLERHADRAKLEDAMRPLLAAMVAKLTTTPRSGQ